MLHPYSIGGHSKDCRHNANWPERIPSYDLWLAKRSSNTPGVHGSSVSWLQFRFIPSADKYEHRGPLRLVFQRFQEYGISISASKCTLGAPPIELNGHCIDREGIRSLWSGIGTTSDNQEPQSFESFRRFLGITSCYC